MFESILDTIGIIFWILIIPVVFSLSLFIDIGIIITYLYIKLATHYISKYGDKK